MRFYAIVNSDRSIARFFESKRKAILDLHYNPLEEAQIFEYNLMPRRDSPMLRGRMLETLFDNLNVESIGNGRFTKIDEVIELCTIKNRVCPEASKWAEFHKLILRTPIAHEFHPPTPMILGNFHHPDDAKKECLHTQVKWCGRYGILNEAYDFLFKLKDENWHNN